MSGVRYNVIVSGKILDGFETDQAKQEFALRFKLDPARVESIFRKGNVVIKKNVPQESADKFIKVLTHIGVAAHLALYFEISDQDEKEGAKKAFVAESVAATAAPVSENTDTSAANAQFEAEQPSDTSASENPSDESVPPSANTPSGNGPVESDASGDEPDHIKPFIFYGNGTEYFRIWIVNILLTIVTLGIYSAWAKVRNAQYFYGHTELADSRFGYHAKPLTILKGRILAVVLFVIYSLLTQISPIAAIVLPLLALLALPWIVVRSLSFNMRVTSWRNIRFGFDGQKWPAAIAFILWPLAGVISFGLLMPLAIYKQQEYIVNNTRYGTAGFRLEPCAKDYYMIYVFAFLILLGIGLVAGLIGFVLPPLSPFAIMVGYLYIFVFISVRAANLIYNNAELRAGDFTFNSYWEDFSYAKMLLINTFLTLITLGFYYPWAKVRVATYKAEHLELEAHANLEGFMAGQAEQVSALGEEIGDVFDMEVGF